MTTVDTNVNHPETGKKRRRDLTLTTPPPTPAKIPDDNSDLGAKRLKICDPVGPKDDARDSAAAVAAGAADQPSPSTDSSSVSAGASLDEAGILAHLTALLDEIATTPYSDTIPARLLTDLRQSMVRIEALCAADRRNTQARRIKNAADAVLAHWFDELVRRCTEEEKAERERNGLPPLEGESGEGEEEMVDVEGLDEAVVELEDECEGREMVTVVA
ncbi:hypothetical protein BC937DRAFT_87469 [Endogone sp. FLAS-F59071]|nr:hypothetical protein BC937DRAFT_87469 [Endogone sp. FLAS-F59071]|eukprot:RUS12586.1 hypothetical protein BC937DRAFT_87469 [Endogone sp. FLAS-F59071]